MERCCVGSGLGEGARIMAFTPITNNMDWAHVDFLNEYIYALRERQFGDGAALIVAGMDVQSASDSAFFRRIQNATLALWSSFCDNTDGDFHGETGSSTAWLWASQAAMLTAAGIGSGFRRATTLPTCDWETYGAWNQSYGIIQAGDIIGPWLFKNMQAIFTALTITRHAVDYTIHQDAYWGDSGIQANWAAATAAAEADWAAYTPSSTKPNAYTKGYDNAGAFRAIMERSTHALTADLSDRHNRSVKWYAMLTDLGAIGAGTSTFDAQGETADGGAFVKDTWTRLATESHPIADGTTITYANTLGKAAVTVLVPNWVAEPSTSSWDVLGWILSSLQVTVEWDFSY